MLGLFKKVKTPTGDTVAIAAKGKEIIAPSGETVELESVETWTVRWNSRYGGYSGDTQPEVEIFLSKRDAEHFRDQLKAAFSLIRHTSGTKVVVQRNN